MKCPVCIDTALIMAERHGVEIDYCPKCRGVWLDRGELDKIIDQASALDVPANAPSDRHAPSPQAAPSPGHYPPPPGAYGYPPQQDPRHYQRKKKWWNDMFDFD